MKHVADEVSFRSNWSEVAKLVFSCRDVLPNAADFQFDYAVVTWPLRVSATFSIDRPLDCDTDYLYISATRTSEDEDWNIAHRLLPAQP